MNANELRLKNLLDYRGTIVEVGNLGYFFETVKPDTTLSYGSDDIRDYEPIPLTEEWLLKFGFIKVMEKGNYITYSNKTKRIGMYKNYCIMRGHGVTFNYVHQLQNLYFALTRTELEIKQNQ